MLAVDIETFSPVSLGDCGVHVYAEDPDFRILLIAYAWDDGPVEVVDLTRDDMPDDLLGALTDPAIIKTAYNAAFERTCLAAWLDVPMPPEQWECTMVRALEAGCGDTDASLAEVGTALGIPADKAKLTAGKALIKWFCEPCTPDLLTMGRPYHSRDDSPEKWAEFIEYNRQDVEAERAVRNLLPPMPESEQRLWEIDQRINDRGARLDIGLVNGAVTISERLKDDMMAEAKELTGLANPNSRDQVRHWFELKTGTEIQSLKKAKLPELRMLCRTPETVRMFHLWENLSKTSVAKYKAMKLGLSADGRARGFLQFHRAITGRWAGKRIQPQNLKRNSLPDLDTPRAVVRSGDAETLEMLYDSPMDTLSQITRTAFIPQEGCRFIVADFSAIEARVLAWLAGETWRLQVFEGDGKIYEDSAARMFGVPVEKIVKGNPEYALRQKGKIAELACIAEEQLVLTDKGLVPIEQVTADHLVWDGIEWVRHEGVVFKGEKEVIEYEGLTATADHLVWIEGTPWPVRFGFAASSGAHLIQSQILAVRAECSNPETLSRFNKGRNYPGCRNCCCGEAQKLVGHKRTARVYDIRNAGPRHRFTVSGSLVHNCGYQGAHKALVSMGALDMGLTPEELPGIVSQWREANPHIVKLWKRMETAIKAIASAPDGSCKTIRAGTALRLSRHNGNLLVTLPSGRSLTYRNIRLEPNEERDGKLLPRYGAGSWIYGGLAVENVVQAIARDCLAETMRTLDAHGYRMVFHVHDEIICEEPYGTGVTADTLRELMSTDIDWAPGLPLNADAYECTYYRKD